LSRDRSSRRRRTPGVPRAATGAKDTFGNLSLTGYNTELGNPPFGEKKEKLANTHVELNRFVLEQERWGEEEIYARLRRARAALIEELVHVWITPLFHVDQYSDTICFILSELYKLKLVRRKNTPGTSGFSLVELITRRTSCRAKMKS
jgi:hypothetical protein